LRYVKNAVLKSINGYIHSLTVTLRYSKHARIMSMDRISFTE